MEIHEIIRQSLSAPRFSHLRNAPNGLILEFGVANGGSLKELAEVAMNRKVYGFDSFYGLPEECGGADHKGSFSTNGQLPNLHNHQNVEIVVGLFQETLPKFLETHPEPMAFVHIDVDLYSSAAFVLEQIEKRFQSNTILAFDELIDWHDELPETAYGHWKNSEYKAFCEMIERTKLRWECIGRDACHQVAIKIL